jgi:peptide/nickel transport system substrate-binding protein
MRSISLHRFSALFAVALLASAMGTAAAEPLHGGSVKGFIAAEPGPLDPHSASISGAQEAIAGIYSSLLQYDPKNPRDIIPDLAERWDVAADGTVYTFHLRQGVQWHDGVPFTAADVLATFTRLLASKRRDAPCGSWLAPVIQRVATLDDYTVRVDLKFPAASFLSMLASPWCRIVAQHVLERDPTLSQVQSQVGTGPFMLKSYEPKRQIVWVRNPHYYDALYPYVDEVIHSIFSHRAQRLRAARFGDVHVWSTWAPMSYAQAQELQKARGDDIELYEWPLNTVWMLYLNPTRAPFNKRDMRRAVHLALDRHTLMEAAFEKSGTPCAILDPDVYGEWALPLETVMAAPGCRQPKEQDLAEAQRLVTTRHPNGVDVDILVRSVGDYLERVQMLVPQLRKIGIRARLRAYESSAAWQAYGQGQYDMIGTEDAVVMLPDPSAPFTMLFAAQTPYNWSRWTDRTVEKLVSQGLRAQEPERRRQIYHELQQHLLTSDSPTVVIGWIDGWYFRDKRLRQYQPGSIGYGNNSLAKVWLAAPPPETPERATAMATPPNRALAPEASPPASPKATSQDIVVQQVTRLFEQFFPHGGAFHLHIQANKAPQAIYSEGEKLLVQVVSDRDAFLQIDYYQANGEVVHLLPNLLDSQQLKAGEVFTLGRPDDAFQFEITPPFGLEMLTVVASQSPLEIAAHIPHIEPADAYIERLAKRFETQPGEANAAAYLPIRTQRASDRH